MKTSQVVMTFTFAFVSISSCFGQRLTESNYDQLVPAGKEADAIYGDFAVQNAAAKAIVADIKATRNANMTVRSVQGCLIDFASTAHESDQLSCFYPGRRKFRLNSAGTDGDIIVVSAKGTAEKGGYEVRYQMVADLPVIDITSTWTNTMASDWTLALEDDIRADGGKEDMVKSVNGTHDFFQFQDIFWQQAYAVRAKGYKIRCNSNSRESTLRYVTADGKPPIVKPGDTFTLARQMIVGKDLASVLATLDEMEGDSGAEVLFSMADSEGQAIAGARIDLGVRGTVLTTADGSVKTTLPQGEYIVNSTVAGVPLFSKDSLRMNVSDSGNVFKLQSDRYKAGLVEATIIDGKGISIPAKVEFIGSKDTPSPDWGPESAEHFVKNLAYTADGTFSVPLMAGDYDIIVSRGPEYDAVFTKLKVEAGKTASLKTLLRRVVDTPGWVSSDFHSHSSPSGDNTGSQKGRVLNLAAEHIEFAPCTEHNRVSTYDHHIAELKLKPFLATVTGMELTGSPLPLNHQNVFPMKYTPRTQDGGGPVTDGSPETQIERLSLWDDRSEKLIQQNHPDLGWLFYDKNGDGKPDEGYSRSFSFMDVVEIHPIDRILKIQQFDVRGGKPARNHLMLNWLQLLNQGFRIYGVVNTDAHYNFHGSGWLRNWIQCGTDDPAKIDSTEMMQAAKQGRLVMSNGPYLEATFHADGKRAVSGQDLEAPAGKVKIDVRVQCANWLDVDQVFLLVNGRPSSEFTFTRAANPEMFADGVVKFEHSIDVTLEKDAHVVVVTGHQTERLGDVAGPQGSQLPAALTNPVFVDVDGGGFQHNSDTLGFPLPVKFKAPK